MVESEKKYKGLSGRGKLPRVTQLSERVCKMEKRSRLMHVPDFKNLINLMKYAIVEDGEICSRNHNILKRWRHEES